jgi:hypothetical protein
MDDARDSMRLLPAADQEFTMTQISYSQQAKFGISNNVRLELDDAGHVASGEFTKSFSAPNYFTWSTFSKDLDTHQLDLTKPEIRGAAERMAEWFDRAGVGTMNATKGDSTVHWNAPNSISGNIENLDAAQGGIKLASKSVGNAAEMGAALVDLAD